MSRATLVFLGLWAAAGQAEEVPGVVSRDVYENLEAGCEGRNIPVTFSRVGAAGDFTRGVTAVVEGVKVPAQVDILRKAPDGKVYRYDPRDAMPYSTATQLLETKDGRKDLRLVRKLRDLENYGEIWYYTKMNEDNAWSPASEGPPAPDADGRWPLHDNGWGHGFAWDVAGGKQTRQYNWHRYGAWSGLVTALEAGVPQAEPAWQVMLPLAGAQGEYDMEMVPRVGQRAGREE